MQAVGFFNNKEGVGKTTLLCNLAAYLSDKHQKKILIIDADPQANASQLMLPEEEFDGIFAPSRISAFTVYSIARPLANGKGFNEEFRPRRSTSYAVDLIVGDGRLALVEDILAQDWANSGTVRGMRTSLMFRQMLEHASNYDYVFFGDIILDVPIGLRHT